MGGKYKDQRKLLARLFYIGLERQFSPREHFLLLHKTWVCLMSCQPYGNSELPEDPVPSSYFHGLMHACGVCAYTQKHTYTQNNKYFKNKIALENICNINIC